MSYHWNWHIFFEPNPMGTGNYLDMLLAGLWLTIKTGVLAWIIALIFGSIVGVLRTLAVADGVVRSASPMSSSSATCRCWCSCSCGSSCCRSCCRVPPGYG